MSYRRRCRYCQHLRARAAFKPGCRKCDICRAADRARWLGRPDKALVIKACAPYADELRAALGPYWADRMTRIVRNLNEERVTARA